VLTTHLCGGMVKMADSGVGSDVRISLGPNSRRRVKETK